MPASAVLLLALVGISFAGPLVRLSNANPLAIAVWRLGFSLVVIAIALVITGGWRQWKRLDARSSLIAAGAGAMLAIHFWSWNASVSMTTVAASVLLVNAQPAIVALLSMFWLREPPTRRQWIGIIIAMLGALVVALPEFSAASTAHSTRALFGDALAFLGAITGATYFVAGRRLRETLDLWPYVGIVYGACFVVLLGFAAATHASIAPQPARELTIFAALALGPMLLGHTGFNWALKYLPAYVVNLTLLGEPVGATLLAATLPGIRELPAVATFCGGALILTGVFVAARAARSRETSPIGSDVVETFPSQRAD
ncbi:MAG TPA: DMT family transporter [Gemmatimonadaceae bacterium]|jgi:drug/metabolite transporter (DMT)-like permease